MVAYLGGALVLAAGGLFLAQQWDDLGFGARVVLLALVAGVLGVSGVMAARGPAEGPSLREDSQDSRRRLAGTLLTGAALTLAFLVGMVVDHATEATYSEVYWPAVLVAAIGIALYLGRRAWPYLAAAVVAVTLVVPEAVSDWTGDSLGAIGAVLVTGVTLLVASFAGYRVRAEAVN